MALCVLWCTSRLNMVPSTARQDNVCAFEAVHGRKLDMNRDLKYSFGDYVEVPVLNTDNKVNNARTDSAIVVQSLGNLSGDFKFYNPFPPGYY